jgi:outer membrane immunogenic protein
MINNKWTCLSAIALGAAMIATSVSAADLAAHVYKKAAGYVAPATVWDGIYVGGHIGYGEVNDTSALGSLSSGGFVGGGQVGYNYMYSPNIMMGLEGDITAFTSSAANPLFTSTPNFTATLAGRLGYATGNVLLYVKGGAAWLDTNYNVFPATAISDTRFGYTVGGGVEYGLSGNWSAKLEYDYLDFGHDTYGINTINTDSQIFKVGLNYRIGSLSNLTNLSAITARY